jgi:hypothetical protein
LLVEIGVTQINHTDIGTSTRGGAGDTLGGVVAARVERVDDGSR